MIKDHMVWEGYLSLDLPRGWEIQEEDSIISIYNPQGVGALQISFARASSKAARIDAHDLTSNFAAGQGFEDVSPRSAELAGLEGSYFEGINMDGELWRIWQAGRNGRAVLISYTCGACDAAVERGEIDEIIASIRWLF
jgi:hypothetical protein